jgi:iron complex outermembrane recepter protein
MVMGNLSYQPGVDRITIGNGIGKPVIRGLSFNRIMLYGQGTRIENQQWDDHHDLGLTDVGVDNVEIVRGPAALIYGADALGGALIFHDEKPAMTRTTEKDFSLGFASNTIGVNGEFGIKGTGKKGIFYGIRAAANSQTSYLQGKGEEENKPAGEQDEFAANSKLISSVAKVNIGMSKTWGTSKLSYSFLNQQIGIVEKEPDSVVAGGNEEEEQRDREMEAPYQDVTTHIISLENTFLTGKSKVNVNLAWQINDRKEYEPLPGKQKELAIGLLLNTATYDLKWSGNAEKKFGIAVGSQGTFLTNENNGKEMLVPDANVSDIAGYGLFRYDKGRLNLLGGVRFDARSIEIKGGAEVSGGIEADSFIVKSSVDTVLRPEAEFEKRYSPFSFSLGAAYALSENLKAKLNAATGFSAPNYAELATFGKHEGTYRFERGKSELNFEQNTEGDLGLIWENEFITLNLGGYVNKIKDYIYIENTGDTMIRITPDGRDTLPIYDYKQNDATISGGEFGFDIHPKAAKWFDLKATYAIINGKLDKGGNLPYIPANKLVGEIKLSKEKIGKLQNPFISFIVSNYGEQTNVAEYELPTDGYTLLDVLAGTSVKLGKHNADIQLFCTNLLNEGYFSHLSLIKAIGVKEMGRNIGLRFAMKFISEKK